ncbi:hypothetical protein A2U01_0075452, partial [Trifolium medium]|nr:hypothetical protein [Trifolium medium]
MKRESSKKSSQDKMKKLERKASTSNQSKVQKKLKYEQEESSSSEKTDSDYAKFLKTYDPNEEDTGSEKE